MKTNKGLIARIVFSFVGGALLNNCSILNIFSPSPYQLIHDSSGNEVLRDTKGGREEFKSSMDHHIEHEIAKDHTPGSKGHDWRAFWGGCIHTIREGSENAQWYVDYIIKARRNVGLPEL